jgi:hypothetical protein
MGYKYPRSIVTNFVDKNPNGTYRDFIAATGSKMVASNFTYIRRKYRLEKGKKPGIPSKKQNPTGKRPYVRRNSLLKVYSRIWFRSTEKMSAETKETIKDLVLELNRSGRTSWEVIELVIPPEIEIREITR